MAVETATTNLYRCDGCGSVKYAQPGLPVSGYGGSIVRTTPDGKQVSAPWWAHTKRCIGNANKNALLTAIAKAKAATEIVPIPPV